MRQYLPTTETLTTHDYPYGRLRATVTFGLEFKAGKGFRTVFQSVDPKSGRVNAPKKSTYYDLILMYRESETGRIKYSAYNLRGEQEINHVAKVANVYWDLLTPEQRKHLYACIADSLRVTAKAMVIYCGAKLEDIKPVIHSALTAALDGLSTGQNRFGDISVDEAALDACKVPGYNPFTVTYHETISTDNA